MANGTVKNMKYCESQVSYITAFTEKAFLEDCATEMFDSTMKKYNTPYTIIGIWSGHGYYTFFGLDIQALMQYSCVCKLRKCF